MAKDELGNPALVTAATTALANRKSANNTPVIVQSGANSGVQAPIVVKSGRGLRVFGIVVLGGITFFVLRGVIRNGRKSKILGEVDTNPNYRAAQSIYNSIPEGLKKGNGSFFNPFGFVSDIGNQIALAWQKTDTNRILDIAKTQITNYDETLKAFRVLYDEDLSALLNKVLTMQELNLFFDFSTAYKASQREVTTSNSGKINYIGTTTKETYALTTWYNPKTQKITSGVARINKLLPKGTYLGKYSGREVKNIMANDTETYYVFTYGKSKSTGDIIHVYVPKKSVKFQSSTSGLLRITWDNYKKGTIKRVG